LIGIAASIVVLAGIAFAIKNGDLTAKVFTAAGDTFTKSIQAATFQKTS
jgi:hypothetical protein